MIAAERLARRTSDGKVRVRFSRLLHSRCIAYLYPEGTDKKAVHGVAALIEEIVDDFLTERGVP